MGGCAGKRPKVRPSNDVVHDEVKSRGHRGSAHQAQVHTSRVVSNKQLVIKKVDNEKQFRKETPSVMVEHKEGSKHYGYKPEEKNIKETVITKQLRPCEHSRPDLNDAAKSKEKGSEEKVDNEGNKTPTTKQDKSKRLGYPSHPVVGLHNLDGYICFLIAALQAINQTDEFHTMMTNQELDQPSADSSRSHNNKRTAVPYTKKYTVTSKFGDDPLNISVTAIPGPVTSALQNTLWLISTEPSFITPSELRDALGKCNPRFVCGTQEDSHEFLRCLLDAIKTEEITNIKENIEKVFRPTNDDAEELKLKGYLRMVSKLPTAISQVVEGTIISSTICHNCHEVTENFEPFFDISVPMPDDVSTEEENLGLQKKLEDNAGAKKAVGPSEIKVAHNRNAFQQHLKQKGLHYQATETDVSRGRFSLESCLAMHTNLDILDENNKFICQNCTEEGQKNGSCASDDVVLCRVSKQLTIHKLPPVLILHFKRFDLNGPTVTKDNRYISFPEILDIAPYCTDKCVEKHGDKHNKILYGLYAAVVHQGTSLHCGHYIAYVKKQPTNKITFYNHHHSEDLKELEYNETYGSKRQWYYTNNTNTRKCQFEDVQKCEAYMLFYELLPLECVTII